jgi:3-keto-disaccharide hydrolase
MQTKYSVAALCLSLGLTSARLAAQTEPGFESLFDGKTLNGWRLIGKQGEGYGVKDGILYCAKGGGGKLLTEKEFSNFIFRFEFKLEAGSNNGVGIRAPWEGDAAYSGMEIQILDDGDAQYAKLRPAQYHGSVYDVVPAKRGALKPVGQWNEETIAVIGRKIMVSLNGQTIVNANLNDVTDPATLLKHPGLLRDRGHIGFLGHNDYVEFRNIQIKELPFTEQDNVAPDGFVALFDGKDLTGWKGLLKTDNPIKRAALSPEQRAEEQKAADENMRAHWKVENGALAFDGKGRSLCTAKDYGDFELLVDWKLPAHGDSGIYLRGSPQVQIWDPHTKPTKAGSEVGSGGLYNNKKNPSKPTKVADKPIGEWNRFRILMVGEKVHVFLNGEQVVNAVTLENYWDYNQPIFPTGQIELQNHGDDLWFKNIYIRELPRK